MLRARRGRLQALVGPLSKNHGLLTTYESCNRRHQASRYDHDGLTACTERCLILGDRFVFSLFFVMLQYSPHPRFIPTCRKPIPFCHLFLSYSPTVCLERLAG